jgi:hypothetical protein
MLVRGASESWQSASLKGRHKELESENRRLRRPMSDPAVDNQILKEVVRGNF